MMPMVDVAQVEAACRLLLAAIGEDPERPGLADTPRRVAQFWREFIEYEPGNNTTFEAIESDQLVAVRGLRVWSLCEHHALPFFCDIDVAYISRDVVLGLSKFARIAHKHAHRLQVQERLVQQIADEITAVVGSPDVAVIGHGIHTCMIMRGIRTSGQMTTSIMRGAFRESPALRQELLTLLSLHDNAIG